MISFERSRVILKKDAYWAINNYKLLSLLVLPAFLMVFFSFFGAEATFGFSIVFNNTFIGIFLTSYLVIEEKNKGTLLALLTTPLTEIELLVGKVSFNFAMCCLFSLITILVNQRFELLVNLPAMLCLVLFAATCCFSGFLFGVFCRNEQELSILGPFVLLLFCLGDAFQKIPGPWALHAFFPDYHLTQFFRPEKMDWRMVLFHCAFSVLLFAASLYGVTKYTQFYFSNNRERRFSSTLLIFLFLFIGALGASGVLVNTVFKEIDIPNKLAKKSFGTDEWKVHLSYPQKDLYFVPIVQVKNKIVAVMKLKDSKIAEFALTIRPTETDEATPAERETKVRGDKSRVILAVDTVKLKDRDFKRWVYLKENKLMVLTESYCKTQIAQLIAEVDFKTGATPNSYLKIYQTLLNNFEFQCFP